MYTKIRSNVFIACLQNNIFIFLKLKLNIMLKIFILEIK